MTRNLKMKDKFLTAIRNISYVYRVDLQFTRQCFREMF
jgi:hypothetical protein